MDAERFAQLQRSGERWAGERAPDSSWLLVRADGRGFSRLTAERYRKPFDPIFHAVMVDVAAALATDLQAVAWYTQSDEITVVLAPWWDQFGRRVEKLVSVAAGIASAACSLAVGAPAVFDARLTVAADEQGVVDNLSWRVADAERNCLQGAGYWGLRQRGHSPASATAVLDGVDLAGKAALLASWGIEVADLPTGQRVGTSRVRRPGAGDGFEAVDMGRPGWREQVADRLAALAAERARP